MIKVGIRTNVPAIGSVRGEAYNRVFSGFCDTFSKELEAALQQINKDIKVQKT